MLEIIAAIATLSVVVTGGAIWILRATTADIKNSVNNSITQMEAHSDKTIERMEAHSDKTVQQMQAHSDQAVVKMQDEFKKLTHDMDRQLEKINLNVDQKIEGVKTYVRDVSIKADGLNDKLHTAETEFLQFKVALPDQFVTRREMEEVRKRVVRLEGPTIQPTEKS